MESGTIRESFLHFFEKRGHAVVASSSLIPSDTSVLLTSAGMQQFKPYYTGAADPIRDFGSCNTASIQKSFRTSDIDQVGDESHLTFFEMLGNFSFGGYFKEEAIRHAYNFMAKVGLPIEYVTVFEGDNQVPADEESQRIWQALGVTDIGKAGRADNFWGPTGNEGPCGPTTEIYAKGTEIWNIVFNEYYCKSDKTLEKLGQNGVDTGMGLERLAMILQNKSDIFETDLFEPLMALLPEKLPLRTKRVIVDHIRAMSFLFGDGLRPSNKEAGYVLRRLVRRVMAYEKIHGLAPHLADSLIHETIQQYGRTYPELIREGDRIRLELSNEKEKFGRALERGIRELGKLPAIDATTAFRLYETFGLPYEIIKEVGGEKTQGLDREAFEREFSRHQDVSRAGQTRKFGGHGLILDTGELKAEDETELKKVTRLHTATHLLNSALRKILGPDVRQDGSDITAERTRFDFTFPRKLSHEELQKIESWVNDAISRDLPMAVEEMAYDDAIGSGALSFFKEKYPSRVKVYTVSNPTTGEILSKELCGGPHIERTKEIGRFKIIKEESSSAGVRRIRATVEP